MELNISAQLAQTAISILAGAGLALYFDLLRLPRLLFPGWPSTFLCDALFCLGALFGLFTLGLGPGGGELRLFMCLFAGLGFVLWRSAPGRYLAAGERRLAKGLKQCAQKLAKRLKVSIHNLKKSGFFKKSSFQTKQDGLQ